jgi:hypothetical protein
VTGKHSATIECSEFIFDCWDVYAEQPLRRLSSRRIIKVTVIKVGDRREKVNAGPQLAVHKARLILRKLYRYGFRVARLLGGSLVFSERTRLLEDLAHAREPQRIHRALIPTNGDE